MARLIAWLKLRGVVGFAVGTETGEYPVLSLSERKQLTEIVVREARGLPVLVNVTAVATTAALDLAQHAARHGAFGCILAPPRGDFTDDEIFQFYSSVTNNAAVPIGVVDPLGRLDDELEHRLRAITSLVFPTPASGLAALRGGRTYTDEFSFPEAVLSPVVTFAPQSLHPNAQPTLIPLSLRNAGSARLVKAALIMQDMEMGPMRGPYQSLPMSLLGTLRQALDALHEAA